MKWNRVFNSELYSLSRLDPKRIIRQYILIIWQKEVLNTKWRETQFSTPNFVLSADLMQNAVFRKVSFKIWKKDFLTQNDVEHSFQQRVVFFEQVWCKRHFLGRNPYNLEKGCSNTKWRGTQFSAASCILWADLMQNAFFRKISL